MIDISSKVIEFPNKRKPPKKGRRFHFLHAWSNWYPIKEGGITSKGVVVGHYKEMEKKCLICGDIRSKIIKWEV